MLKTKKMLSLILTMGMIFTLAACGVQKTNDALPITIRRHPMMVPLLMKWMGMILLITNWILRC